VVGEYRTAPDGRGLNPSRTTVDLFGNVWTANRNEDGSIDGVPHGSAVKIGLIVGGTRVDESGAPDPQGGYLAAPYAYNTCIDRNGDGLIRTSKGLGDVLDWPDLTDGPGGTDGLVQDAVDECILVYQRLPGAEQARHVSVDADNNVWVGGYPFLQRLFYKLDGSNGAILDSFDAREIGCGGYGGLIDGNGILWSVGGELLRYDPVTRSGFCIPQNGYGLGIDNNGYIWMSLWDGGIVKVAPDGTVVSGFPKPTYPPAPMTSSLAVPDTSPMMAVLPQNETVASIPALPEDAPAAFLMPADEKQQGQPLLKNEFMAAFAPLAEDPSVTFWVAPVYDWVQSWNSWTPGATITLTVEEAGTVVYSASQTANSGGYFMFNLWDVFDLQRGQTVTVTDGIHTKTHTVPNLFVDEVDFLADAILGRSEPGASVEVGVNGNGSQTVTVDGSGNWTADFSGLTDLTYLSEGSSRQYDSDGDSTSVWWSSPSIQVVPVNDWVQSMRPFTPGATIALTVEEGGAVVYSASQIADTHGNFQFNLWDIFDLQRGQVVTVSDGRHTKIHTIANLFVDGIDVSADTVFGRSEPGARVDVWVNGNGGQTVTVDGSGNWTADFSGQTDLTELSNGSSRQFDSDGDSTDIWWARPRIQAAPVNDWVQSSHPWSPGATITLTIEEGGSVVYSDSQAADIDGNFNFNLQDQFELQRGQVVTVSDGRTTKTLTIANLFVDGVDVTSDTIFGRAEAGASVEIWVHGDGNRTTTVDSSGNWNADFSGQTDLTYRSDGGSQQFDSDGDSTAVWWSSPSIQVAPEDNWVQSQQPWRPGANITLTIEESGVVVYSDSQLADEDGNFNFNLWDRFELQRGQVVTVSDGTITKTHTVISYYVDGVDIAADTIFGRAEPGTDVDVWVHGDGRVTVTADGSGNWRADFSGMTDLTYLSDGGSQQFDSDGDSTGVWWSSPKFQVSPADKWVQSSSQWTPGSSISLTIEQGGTVVYSDSQIANANGHFNFNLWNEHDLQRGQVVTVSDGTITKSHTVTNLFVDTINVALDTVVGRADPGTPVKVWASDGNPNLIVTADDAGNWIADFSDAAGITYLSDGNAEQIDDDGDSTWLWWAPPRFQVAPEDDWVQSWAPWTPGATISLIIEDAGVVVYSDSQVANENGNFNFNLWDVFDLQRGQVVTVSDGTSTKTHTVIDYFVDGVDTAAETVFGRAEPGTDVEVWVHGDGNRTATADGTGNWTADFSDQTDLTYLSDGGSQQFDSDGDATGVWWSSPSFQVSPDDNWIQQWNRWKPGATISLTVEEGGAVVYSNSLTVDSHGNFYLDVVEIDLLPGQQVTVSDGITSKTHTVIDVSLTDIDTDADQIRGIASPGARIWVWVNRFDNGSGRWASADPSGNWAVDFSIAEDGQPSYDITDITRIDVNEYDEDGDSSFRQFGPPTQQNRGVAVTAADNNIWVANSAYGTVTRLDNDGNVIKVIETGLEPTGVAVDAAGNVWATNMSSHNTVRIDPDAGSDGLGAVDLTVDLGPDAWPYNYSDMTGTVVVGATSPQGFWTVVQDSQTSGVEWGRITWNTEAEGSEPPGTAIVVEARAADTEAGLGGETFQPITNGELFSMAGRFIEVRVTLKASPGGISPVLSDIRIQPNVINVDIDIKPGSDPNSINCKNKNGVIAVAVLTTEDFEALTVDHTTVTFEGASETHVDKRSDLPRRHVEDVDSDGDMDLVFHFRSGDTALTCQSTIGQLDGLTYDGIPIEGTDSVRMINH
jgi:hypothetical protein